jgi:hypothetical protein
VIHQLCFLKHWRKDEDRFVSASAPASFKMSTHAAGKHQYTVITPLQATEVEAESVHSQRMPQSFTKSIEAPSLPAV